jgi:hypothetical protein
MLVVVPTRGRPQNVARLEQALKDTRTSVADFLYVADNDDPSAMDYARMDLERLSIIPRKRLVGSLNFIVPRYTDQYDAIGFMGDDHLPVTRNWDLDVLGQVVGPMHRGFPRVVYGNDLIQGPVLPTAVFMSSRIVKALGWFAPPCLVHLYADNFWLALGEELGELSYLPDTVIQHLHPAGGTAPWDERYAEVNAPAVDVADREAWLKFRADGSFDAAVKRVREEYAR